MSTESRDPATDLDHGDSTRRAGSAELELIRYLRRSRDQFAAIFHGVSEGIMVRNNTGGLVYLNNAASGLLGCSSQHEVLDGPAQEPTLDKVQVLDEEGEPLPFDQLPWRVTRQGDAVAWAVLRFRDIQTGAERVAIVRSAPIFDDSGRVELEVTTMTDITERKRAEEEAEARGRLLEALFETSPVGIFMVDAGENILYVNSELARICGRPAEPGGRAQDFWKGMVFYRRDGAPYKANELPLQRALGEQEKVLAQEVFLHREDGSIVPTLVNATPTYSATGQVTGGILVMQDVSPLEEAAKFRTEFLGMVSHELKNPLSNIKLTTYLGLDIQASESSSEVLEYFQIIRAEANRMQDIIDELLDINRIEAGIIPLTQEPQSLPDILEEGRQTFSRRGRSNAVVIHLPPALPQADVDRGRVLQVLDNLLENAAKYSPPASPITLQAEFSPFFITVHVQDQGLGIPPDKLPLLFNKFTRLHTKSETTAPGVGLGLAICKGIVEGHGGRIWCSSAGENQGSTFSFTLPVHTHQPIAAVSSSSPGAVWLEAVRDESARPATVLVVDDEENATAMIRRLLDQAGYRPVVTNDPAQVPLLVDAESPDLALLDLMMPGTSGFEVFKETRRLSDVPIVFLTASDSPEDMKVAKELGAAGYITKPYSPAELLALIQAVLQQERVG